MTIVVIGSRYYRPVENGYQEISKALAMSLYEEGAITHEEVLNYD